MPYKCIVPLCKSNYDSQDKKKSIFSFPSNEILRQKWIKSIPRENLIVNKNSRVCELHFNETDIQRETDFFDSTTGKRISFNLDIPRLREGAIPCIFKGCPLYLSKKITYSESRDKKNLRMKDLAETMAIESTDNTEVMEVDLTSETLPTTKQPLVNGVSSTKKGASDFELILKNPASTSLDIDRFLSSCRDSVVKNYKDEMDILVEDINSSLLSATNVLHQAEQSAQNLINFIASKHSLFKTPLNRIQQYPQVKTYCKNTVTNNVHLTSVLNSTRKDVTGDGLEILSTVTSIPKANLPPAGELIRSPLETGTRVWAMKTNLLNVWVKGTITVIRMTTPDKLYKVRLDSQKFLSQKFYNAKQLAYENPASVIVPVGTRIIARYTDSAGRSAHYAGIVAEPPKVTNLKRYLIFFDDGCAQYVTHEDIYVVCAQSIDVADDCHENMNDFVRGYLLQYPERPMVKLQKDQFVKTEYNSEWSDAKVLEVDCSMVKMKFMTSQRIEWIYRGSTRLKPLRNELANAEAHRLEGKNRRRHTFPRRPHQPYVEYTREEDVVVIDSDSDDEKNKAISTEIKSNKPRNTARKSLAPRPPRVHQRITGPMFFRVPDKKSHLGIKEIAPSRPLTRVQFHPHDCSILCQEKNDPAKHKETNPLIIPINLGWERQLRRFRTPGPGAKIIVTYRAPCGRHLRNLQEIQDYLYLVDSRITIDMFTFNTNVVVFRSFKPQEVLYNDDDITRGKENTRVPCINSLSDEPPPYVEYSAERFPSEGVYLNLDPDFLCGCECTDNCQNAATCACQQLTNYARYGKPVGDAGYKFRRLTEALVTGVYECNSRCSCNSKCGNRVVQNGITVRLQMFKTLYKGWGIRCLDDLDAGQFICIYAGQLLTEQGADIGGKECGDEYLAELDHIEVVEKAKEGYESDVPEFEPMEIDKDKKEDENYVASSEDQYSSDSDVLFADSDSEFESSLRSTATSTYATRSRQRHGKKGSTNSSVDNLSNILSEDSGSSHDNLKKDIKGLPDLSTNLETFKINPQPPSPESAEILDKIELKRKPKISDEVDMDTPKNSPENVKMESSGLDEKLKCETSSDSQNPVDIKVEETCDGKKFVAKKSVSMKNPLTSLKCEQQDYKFKSVRSYFGEDSLYIMDARSKGNIGRYLNHSCEPNVFVQNVFVDTHDLRFPTVAFFAFDAIDAGTELTWDYNYEVNSVADKIMYCYCEAPSCRGRLL